MARVPTLAEEDAKWPNRERECLVRERTRIVNRTKGTLARLGIRDFKPTLRKAAGPFRQPSHSHKPIDHNIRNGGRVSPPMKIRSGDHLTFECIDVSARIAHYCERYFRKNRRSGYDACFKKQKCTASADSGKETVP